MSDEQPKTYGEAGIDLASIERNWPDGHDVPQLIRDVAEFMRAVPLGTLGYAEFQGLRFDDYYLEDGADLAAHFGMFLGLGEGSRIALWLNEVASRGQEPVINLGSEGEVKVIADSIEGFFAAWALDDRTLLPEAMGMDYPNPDDIKNRQLLADFLRWRLSIDDLRSLAGVKQPHPDLPKSLDQHGAAARARSASDPNLVAMRRVLDAYIPRGNEPWQGVRLLINVVGGRMTITTPSMSYLYEEPLPAALFDQLAPLIHAERNMRADPQRFGKRGLWHSCSLELSPDGTANIKAYWATEPKFVDGKRATRA